MGIQLEAPARVAGKVEPVASHEEAVFKSLKRNEQLVYEALSKSETPLKAYELLDHLQEHGLRAPMTIYRALEALIAKGCVRKITSLNAFVAVRPSRTAQARAFLICRECMQAREITLDERQVTGLFSPMQVSAGHVLIEAYGDCRDVCGSDLRVCCNGADGKE